MQEQKTSHPLIEEADKKKNEGKHVEAITLCERVLAGDLSCVEAYEEIGDNYLSLRKYDRAEKALEASGVIINKNLIPFDKLPAAQCSGIRIGSPALTTRGFKEPQMRQTARLVDTILTASGPDDHKLVVAVGEIRELCRAFPLD